MMTELSLLGELSLKRAWIISENERERLLGNEAFSQ